jgi:hypothetical protein
MNKIVYAKVAEASQGVRSKHKYVIVRGRMQHFYVIAWGISFEWHFERGIFGQ